MKKTWLVISISVIGMCAFALAGYWVGCTKTTDSLLLLEMLSSQTSLRTCIKTAEILKANQKEKAEELLENLIDVHVSSLGVQVHQKSYAPIRQEMIQSIREAKEYRNKWPSPNHKVNENLKRGVDAAFGMN